MSTEKTYTHVYTADTINSEPFLVHEDRFDKYIDELVEQCGADYRHSLEEKDQAGNPWYVTVDAFVDISDMPETIKLEFDKDGVSANTPHIWRVNYSSLGWPESITYADTQEFDADGYIKYFDVAGYGELLEDGTYKNWEAAISDYCDWVLGDVLPANLPELELDEEEIADIRHELREAALKKVTNTSVYVTVTNPDADWGDFNRKFEIEPSKDVSEVIEESRTAVFIFSWEKYIDVKRNLPTAHTIDNVEID